MVSDRGSQFTSAAFKEMTDFFGIKHHKTTAYHPQSDGMLETYHRVIKNALKSYLGRDHWMDFLPFVLLGIRSSIGVHSSVNNEIG